MFSPSSLTPVATKRRNINLEIHAIAAAGHLPEYGIENAAGYDGFGLARYSRLAGDMKLWGN